MKVSFWLCFLGCFLAFSGCALSPGRQVLVKDDLVVNVSLGGALVDQVRGIEWIPIPVNLSVGAMYGVSDNFSAGGNLYVIPLLTGSLLAEPVAVYNIAKQSNFISEWNTYFTMPVQFTFKNADWNAYPALGITPVAKGDNMTGFLSLEIKTDFQKFPSPSLSVKAGGRHQTWKKVALEGEIGLINIGEESIVSPLSRMGIGVPVFSIGTSINTK